MWPFFSNTPKIQQISEEGEHYIIIHNKGAIKLSNSEIIDIKTESDVFSPRKHSRYPTLFSLRAMFFTFIVFGGIMNILFDSVYGQIHNPILIYFSTKAWLVSFPISILIYFISTYLIKSLDLLTKRKNGYFKDLLTISFNQNTIKLRYRYQNANFNQLINSRIIDDEKPIVSKQISIDKFFKNAILWGGLTLSISGIVYFYFCKIPSFHLIILKFLPELEYRHEELGTLFETYFTNYHQNYLRLFFDGALSVFIAPLVLVIFLFLIALALVSLFSIWFGPSIISFKYLVWKRTNERIWISYLFWSLLFALSLYLNFQFYHNWSFIVIVVSATVTIFALFIYKTNIGDYTTSRKIGIWICLLFYSPFFNATITDSVPKPYLQYFLLGLFVCYTFLAFIQLLNFLSFNTFDEWKTANSRNNLWNKMKTSNPQITKISNWVRNDGLILESLPNDFKQYYAVVSSAMDQNIESFQFAPIEIKTDKNFIEYKLKKYRMWNTSNPNKYDLHITYLENVLLSMV